MERTLNVASGLSFESMGFILFLVFMVLKLVGVIDWSWFYVTLPLWIPIAFYTLAVTAVMTVCVIAGKVEDRKWKKKK